MDNNKKKAAIYTALIALGIVLFAVLFINFPFVVLSIMGLSIVGAMIFLIYLGILEFLDDKDML